MADDKDEKIEKFLKERELNKEIDLKKLSLKKSNDLIKYYKYNAGNLFREDVSRGLNYENMISKHPLFKSTDSKEYEKFKIGIKKIEQLNTKIEQIKKAEPSKEMIRQLQRKREDLTQKRRKFFRFSAKPYISVCKNYEKIAKQFGQLNAQLKGIQKEKEESQLLNYWALILEKPGSRELLLIHRNDMRKAKQYIRSNKEGDQKLHQFYSLTLRALNKLCFGFQGTKDTEFLKKVKEELAEYKSVEGGFSFKSSSGNQIDEKKLIKFYQNVLKSNYAKNVLEIKFFHDLENILNKEFQSLNEFQSDLEKVCYLKRTYTINDEIKTKLLEMDKTCLFKITSYDLSLHDRDIKIRHHTELWKEFWSGKNKEAHYPIRLNPEISISWRGKQDYRFTEGKYVSVKRNRFLKSQWNLKTSLTLNATEERIDLSFKKPEDVKKEIVKFNKRFFESMKDKQIFYYGLDRGLAELATLCVIKEDSKSDNGFILFPIETYTLKKEMYDIRGKTNHTASKNPSYFINEPDLFKKNKNPTLDLTTAKLIDGKIVENGDIFTYLRLKELSAKRELFKCRSEMEDQKVFLSSDNKSLYIKISQSNDKTIYYFTEKFAKIQPIEDIQKDLQNYLNELNKNQTEDYSLTKKKINHLRNAIASNIVGILSFLHKKNQGLIILEENQKSRNSDENIAVQLEWALYRKFQTEGLVPPCLKEADLLLENAKKSTKNTRKHNRKRSENNSGRVENFGLIYFVDPTETSQICPNCDEQSTKENFKKRKKEGWFQCEKCGFNTKDPSETLSFFDSSDKIAAYAICKKGKKRFRS